MNLKIQGSEIIEQKKKTTKLEYSLKYKHTKSLPDSSFDIYKLKLRKKKNNYASYGCERDIELKCDDSISDTGEAQDVEVSENIDEIQIQSP